MVTSSSENNPAHLERGLGLKEATALNMIDMVGIGPFIVIPFVVKTMGGPQAMIAWVAGAVLALMDGFVLVGTRRCNAQSGGSYFFLRESYGPARWGKVMSFLLIWQTMFQAPLVIASGAIGFAQYFTYLVPLTSLGQKAISGALVIILVVLLYRRITTIGRLSLLLWTGLVLTFIWLIWGGVTHFDRRLAFDFPVGAWNFSWLFFAGRARRRSRPFIHILATIMVCHLGGEIKAPEKNIPRSIFISILGIAILYLAMQLSIFGVVPWKEIAESPFIVSTFVERIYGEHAAAVATILILWIAFASLFSALLGYSAFHMRLQPMVHFLAVRSPPFDKTLSSYFSARTGGDGIVFSLMF